MEQTGIRNEIRRKVGQSVGATFAVAVLMAFVQSADAKPVKHHPATAVKDRYIVMFTSATPAESVEGLSQSLAATHGLGLVTVWGNLKGFLADGPGDATTALAQDPRVELVEEDHIMRGPMSGTIYTGTAFTGHITNEDRWFLDRLDDVSWAGGTRDNTYNMCPEAATANATAYLIDEPVWKAHDAFTNTTVTTIDCSRDVGGIDPRTNRARPLCVPRDAADACKNDASKPGIFLGQAHGTAVASLLAGKHTGAARPEIVSVNVYPCESNNVVPTNPSKITRASYIIAALDWIKGDIEGRRTAGTIKPTVINHSGYVLPWDTEAAAVMNSVRDVAGMGIPYFTSADNFSGDACQFTPNMYAYTRGNKHWTRVVFVVGGSSMNDQDMIANDPDNYPNGSDNPLAGRTDVAWQKPRSVWDVGVNDRRVENSGTNLGACVSAFAPATKIIAAAHGDNFPVCDPTTGVCDFYRGMDPGSSWSSPLVAGIALRWMVSQVDPLHPVTTIPGRNQTYDKLLNDPTHATNPGFDGPLPKSFTNTTYRICYNPNDATDWKFVSSTATACGMSSVNSGVQLQPFDMPAATNSSDARMVTWTSACP